MRELGLAATKWQKFIILIKNTFSCKKNFFLGKNILYLTVVWRYYYYFFCMKDPGKKELGELKKTHVPSWLAGNMPSRALHCLTESLSPQIFKEMHCRNELGLSFNFHTHTFSLSLLAIWTCRKTHQTHRFLGFVPFSELLFYTLTPTCFLSLASVCLVFTVRFPLVFGNCIHALCPTHCVVLWESVIHELVTIRHQICIKAAELGSVVEAFFIQFGIWIRF